LNSRQPTGGNRRKNQVEEQLEEKVDTNPKSNIAHALRLFSEGKTPVEVAITLDLPADEVQAIYRDFWELRHMHKLTEKYEQIRYFPLLLEITQDTK
jgi:hypothetical protein